MAQEKELKSQEISALNESMLWVCDENKTLHGELENLKTESAKRI